MYATPVTSTLPPNSPLNGSGNRSVAYAEIVKGILLSFAYFTLARNGFFTRYDGPLFAVAASLVFPQWRPCLLLMVLSIQDAPGQVVMFDYLGVAGISGLMILSAALQRSKSPETANGQEFRGMLRLALFIANNELRRI